MLFDRLVKHNGLQYRVSVKRGRFKRVVFGTRTFNWVATVLRKGRVWSGSVNKSVSAIECVRRSIEDRERGV